MQEFGLIKSPEKIELSEGLFCQFFSEHRVRLPDFHPELLSGPLKVSSCGGHDIITVDVDGMCQSSVGRAPFCS